MVVRALPEPPLPAPDPRDSPLAKGDAGPPDERPVAEHPNAGHQGRLRNGRTHPSRVRARAPRRWRLRHGRMCGRESAIFAPLAELDADPRSGPRDLGYAVAPRALAGAAHHQQIPAAEVEAVRSPAPPRA